MIESFTKNGSIELPLSTKNLLLMWEKAEVPEPYQQFVLAYLPTLTKSEADNLLEKEAEEMQAKPTLYNKLIE
jgi:hypothetical protein